MGPVPPPLAAARPVICHGPPYRLLMLPARPRNLPWAPVYRLLMLLQVQCVSLGPCTASHCCCLHPPHSALCRLFQVSSTLTVGFHFVHRVLDDYGPNYTIAAARPVICTWDPVPASSMLLPGQSVLMGPCTASHCCCLHRPHSAMCLFQVSSTLLVGSILS
ncbi:unnamed protein product [Staurois parvus]|uniref:Uncharacterized protein n=1 Tax=Staurois parvus TaxID=386267 RepID=A0ABN9AVI0_9NEOB|nr:unnamed protein product [Staurois parvus]